VKWRLKGDNKRKKKRRTIESFHHFSYPEKLFYRTVQKTTSALLVELLFKLKPKTKKSFTRASKRSDVSCEDGLH
jgi:hypothetical protein